MIGVRYSNSSVRYVLFAKSISGTIDTWKQPTTLMFLTIRKYGHLSRDTMIGLRKNKGRRKPS